MLDEFLLIKCVEVRGQGLRDDRLDHLRLRFRLRYQLEALVGLHVRRLALELCRFVLAQADHVLLGAANLTNGGEHFIVLPELSLLLFSIVLRVIGLALERQRVEWVLRVLLMEYILLSILPVGERLHVTRLRQNWLAIVRILSVDLLLGLDFERLKVSALVVASSMGCGLIILASFSRLKA